MAQVKEPLIATCTFVWIGFVCAISFMEAWLKFCAPGINLQLGLGIGRLVFNALNKVELVMAGAILINLMFSNNPYKEWPNLLFMLALVILVVQTFYLLPALDQRAETIINAGKVVSSNLHFYYVGVEFIKVISLIIFGVKQFK
ncbi:MAG: hypothetical protein V4565_08360 [Bacteroidota bacterium]